MPMTLDELKRGAVELSEEDRLRLRFFLLHIERVDTEANRAELARIHRAMNAGERVSLEQWEKMHAALEAEGL